ENKGIASSLAGKPEAYRVVRRQNRTRISPLRWLCSKARWRACSNRSARQYGGVPMSTPSSRRVVRLFRELRPPEGATYRLTPQETELPKLLVGGHYKKTAARAMGISTNTVSFHRKNIYAKLQVHSKAEPVAKAFRAFSEQSAKG